MSQSNITIGLFLGLTACSASLNNSPFSMYELYNSTTASSSAYTSSIFSTQPAFTISAPIASSSDAIQLNVFLDPSCSTPADGTLVTTQNPVNLNAGTAAFSGVSYALPGHLEETVYFKATDLGNGINVCTTGTSILQHFNAGSGFTVFANGVDTGLAGGNGGSEFDIAEASQVDSKGRLVVAGISANASGGGQLAIWRYNPDGSLDTNFAGTGYATFGATGATGAIGSSELDVGVGLQIDSLDRILVSGSSANTSGGHELTIWRYTSAGLLDTTFGSGLGYVLFGSTGAAGATGAAEDDAGSLFLDTQGRLIIYGQSYNASGGAEIAIWRYTPNGILDTTFGSGLGYVLSGAIGATGATGNNEEDVEFNAKLDSQSRILVVGKSKGLSSEHELAIWRFTADGALDTSFGSGLGHVVSGTVGFAGATGGDVYDEADAVQIDSVGRILIAGDSENASGGVELVILRFTADGVLDTSFGSGLGYVLGGSTGATGTTGGDEDDQPSAFQIDSQNRFVLPGVSYNSSEGAELVIWRYRADGTPDTSFGSGAGVVLFGSTGAAGATGSSEHDSPTSFYIDSQGRYLLSGTSITASGGYAAAFWRYLPNGNLDL